MTEPFRFSNGQIANDANDLLKLCQHYPDEATSFLVTQDLENWLAYIGNYEAAECATNARQTDMSDRQKLEEFINRYRSLTASNPVPEAVTATNIEDNLTAPESASTITDVPEPANTVNNSPSATTESLEPATPPKQPASMATATASPESTANTSNDSANANSTDNEEKPSFFQVVAKLLVKIFSA